MYEIHIEHQNCLSLFFQDDKDEDMCEEEEPSGNGHNSANRKRQLWWEFRQGTDEKNVRQGYNAHMSGAVLIIGHLIK